MSRMHLFRHIIVVQDRAFLTVTVYNAEGGALIKFLKVCWSPSPFFFLLLLCRVLWEGLFLLFLFLGSFLLVETQPPVRTGRGFDKRRT